MAPSDPVGCSGSRFTEFFFFFIWCFFFLLVFIESYRWPQRRRGTPRSEPKPALVIGAGGPLVAISTTTTTKRAKGFHSWCCCCCCFLSSWFDPLWSFYRCWHQSARSDFDMVFVYWVVPGCTGFYLVSNGFLLGFAEFSWIFIGFYRVLLGFI